MGRGHGSQQRRQWVVKDTVCHGLTHPPCILASASDLGHNTHTTQCGMPPLPPNPPQPHRKWLRTERMSVREVPSQGRRPRSSRRVPRMFIISMWACAGTGGERDAEEAGRQASKQEGQRRRSRCLLHSKTTSRAAGRTQGRAVHLQDGVHDGQVLDDDRHVQRRGPGHQEVFANVCLAVCRGGAACRGGPGGSGRGFERAAGRVMQAGIQADNQQHYRHKQRPIQPISPSLPRP